MSGGFDRLRPRQPQAPSVPPSIGEPNRDVDGKRALFSAVPNAADEAPAFGSFTVTCSACGGATVLSAGRALRHALPSVHLPLLRRRYPSYMRCPACQRRTWVRLAINL